MKFFERFYGSPEPKKEINIEERLKKRDRLTQLDHSLVAVARGQIGHLSQDEQSAMVAEVRKLKEELGPITKEEEIARHEKWLQSKHEEAIKQDKLFEQEKKDE